MKDMKIDKEVFLIIFIVLSSSIALLIYSQNIQPIRCSIDSLEKYDGKYVDFEGIVVYIFNYSNGMGMELKSTNKNSSSRVTVFCDFFINAFPGSKIEVKGIVSNGGNIVNAYSIKILRKYYETTLEEILRNPNYFLGLYIKVEGKVENDSCNNGILENKSKLIVTDGVHEVKVFLSGDYFGERCNLHFYGKYDGREIICYPKPYGVYLNSSQIPIKEISFENLKKYVGKEVHIVGDVLSYETYGYTFYLKDGKFRVKCYSSQKPNSGEIQKIVGKFLYDYNEGYYYIRVKEI